MKDYKVHTFVYEINRLYEWEGFLHQANKSIYKHEDVFESDYDQMWRLVKRIGDGNVI